VFDHISEYYSSDPVTEAKNEFEVKLKVIIEILADAETHPNTLNETDEERRIRLDLLRMIFSGLTIKHIKQNYPTD
jgi:hypothetical protein